MLREALEKLGEWAEHRLKLQEIESTDSKSVFYDREKGFLVHENEGRRRYHSVYDLDSLNSAVEKYRGDDASIWVGYQKIIAVLFDDSPQRIDTIEMPIAMSPLFNLPMMRKDDLQPKELVHILQTKVAPNSETNVDDLVHELNNLKFTTDEENEQQKSKGVDRLGKSIRSQVTNADKLRDTFSFEFAGYPEIAPNLRCEVEFSLSIDPVEQTVCVQPLLGSVERAKRESLRQLHAVVSAMNDISTFMGQP